MINEKNIDLFLFFYHLAKNNSFEKTIKSQHVSRTTIYRKIKELETLLGGHALVIGHAKAGVSLTPYGEKVYSEVCSLVNNISKAEKNLMALDGDVQIKQTITIVTTSGFLSLVLLHAIDLYTKKNKDINFVINTVSEEFIASKFTYDIAYFPEATVNKQKFILEETGWINNVYFASKSYIAQYGQPKDIEDLNNHHILKFHIKDKEFRGPTDWLYSTNRLKNPPKIIMNSLFGRLFAVSRGMGIANLPVQINILFNLGLIPIDTIPGSKGNNYGIVLKSKYSQDYIRDFFDFSLREIRLFLKK